jgi:hypothetical protein
MKKKQYISPSVIAVEFKMERGYAISFLRFTMDEQALDDFNDYGQENWDEDQNSNFFGSW